LPVRLGLAAGAPPLRTLRPPWVRRATRAPAPTRTSSLVLTDFRKHLSVHDLSRLPELLQVASSAFYCAILCGSNDRAVHETLVFAQPHDAQWRAKRRSRSASDDVARNRLRRSAHREWLGLHRSVELHGHVARIQCVQHAARRTQMDRLQAFTASRGSGNARVFAESVRMQAAGSTLHGGPSWIERCGAGLVPARTHGEFCLLPR